MPVAGYPEVRGAAHSSFLFVDIFLELCEQAVLYLFHFQGSGCKTVVEHTPQDRQDVGPNPTMC